MCNWRISIVVALVCLTVGCTPRDFLTRSFAFELISNSKTFRSVQHFWLRTGTTSNQDYLSPESIVLQRHGWITAASVNCPPSIAPPPCWDVALTPLGVGVFRDLIPANAINSQSISIPVARRQLIGVTGISKSSSTAEVDFEWRFSPLNEVGEALYSGGVQYESTVVFRHYDDGWRVIEGDLPRADQGMEEALKNSQPTQ